MYVFMRVLRRAPIARERSAAIAYAFSGFFIVSVNFTMIIAAAAWLPLMLACIEMIVRQLEQRLDEPGGDALRGEPVPVRRRSARSSWALQILAGHVEITYYTLMVAAFYAAVAAGPGVLAAAACSSWRGRCAGTAAWLVAMVVLGLALGGVQLLPLYELVRQSFREGSASLQQVRDWAWPSRQIITFLLPDFFGNPTHHAYFDIWQRAWVPVTQNALGEAAEHDRLGREELRRRRQLPRAADALLLAVHRRGGGDRGGGCALGCGSQTDGGEPDSTTSAQPLCSPSLAVLSLLFAFGTPLYALLYYGLPGYSQLHSAFRWVFPYTLSMAVLAGFGLDWLLSRPGQGAAGCRDALGWARGRWRAAGAAGRPAERRSRPGRSSRWATACSLGLLVGPGDDAGFADGAMVWSYEAVADRALRADGGAVGRGDRCWA